MERRVLLYACAVGLMAISTSILVINIGMAETERSLVTLAGVLLFLLGIYGAWAWSRRRRARQARAAAES
jgi:cbb3-type cytochrome oxidase subunit 3